MRFYFSKKITIIGLIAAALMVRASFWQAERYEWKLGLISKLNENVSKDPLPVLVAISDFNNDTSNYIHRRVIVNGKYDFSKEIVLRNRRFKDEPGVFVITPLKVDGSDQYILVNRGFLPLAKASQEKREIFHRPESVSFLGLLKETMPPKFLAPSDKPADPNNERIDSWVRVDVENISKQLPYSVAPFYLEIMKLGDNATGYELNSKEIEEQILDTSAGKEELFFLPGRSQITAHTQFKDEDLPIPIFDTVIPPGRHYGYIFEWAIMAAVTLLITFGLQLRKPKRI